jgi:oligopeptide transport system substrate-binding protein
VLRLAAIPLALLALLAAALWWSGGSAARPADFSFINRGEIGTLDPNRMAWLQDIRIGYALWEGLYTLDPATLDAIPGSAGRIDVSDDKTVWTFHIRPEARWSNGDELRAGDFVFAWKRMLDQPGDYTYLFHYIRGAKEYQDAVAAGKRPAFGTVGIEALDARTLRVRLRHPVAFFPDMCAFSPFFPLHEPSMRPFAQEADPQTGVVTYDHRFTRAGNLVSNGPYRLAAWEFKRRLRLERSEHYWDRAGARSQVIEVVSAEDPQVAFLKYESGSVDWLSEVSPEIAAELRAKGRGDLRVFGGFGTYFYSINCLPKLPDGRANPFADVRVRQAFAMAIDKRPIVATITRMGEQPAATYIPPGAFASYRSPRGLAFDPEGARKLLADAGFAGGRGFPKISLLFNNEAHHSDVAQNVRRQWLTALGVEVEMEGVEIKSFRQRLHAKEYAVARASWIGDYNDPSTFSDKYKSVSDNNDSGWVSAEYDALCAAADVEPDASRRLELFGRAEKVLCDEVPIIPIYHYVNVYLFRDNVSGVPLNPRNMVMFKAVEARR